MNKIYVILYTYDGYDGEIDRLETDFYGETGEDYLAFATKELAEKYLTTCRGFNNANNEYEIKEVKIRRI